MAVNSDFAPQGSLADEGPFRRAYIRCYGRTQDAAIEEGRSIRARLALVLSNESTCYPPRYGGFDDGVRRHYAIVVVAVGGDRAAEEGRIKAFLARAT